MGSRSDENMGIRLWEAGVIHAGHDEVGRTSEGQQFSAFDRASRGYKDGFHNPSHIPQMDRMWIQFLTLAILLLKRVRGKPLVRGKKCLRLRGEY